MAGEQDIMSFGLDVSSFTPQKKQILQDYILLFEKLETFNGKIINPIQGDGLSKFNISVAETNRLLNEMNQKLYLIQVSNNSLTQALTSNLNITNANANALNKLARGYTGVSQAANQAGSAANNFTVHTYAGGTAIESLGKKLTGLLTNLRYVAYILPGIGIAGIFNLAYEAIEKAGESLGLFTTGLEKSIDFQLEFNKGLEEEIKFLKQLYDLRNEIIEQSDGARTTEKDALSFDQARGYETLRILNEKKAINEAELQRHTAEVIARGQAPETLKADLDRRFQVIKDYTARVDKINAEILRLDSPTKTGDNRAAIAGKKGIVARGQVIEGVLNPDKETLNKLKENILAKQKADTDSFNFDKDLLDKYTKSQKEYFTIRAELARFDSEQELKLLVETTKSKLSVNQEYQKQILDDDRNFYDTKRQAIIAQYNNDVKNAQNDRIKVTGVTAEDSKKLGIKENVNVSSTAAEIKIAREKEKDEVEKAQVKQNENQLKLRIEFYQRYIKAIEAAGENELKSESTKNKAIETNVQKSLTERLDAYQKFVEAEQKIADLQLSLDLQKGADKKGGKTSLTQEEQNKLISDSQKKKEAIIADSEKRIYDIVHSSLEQQLQEVVKENEAADIIDQSAHINALQRINKKYEDHKISLKRYRITKAKIEYEYDKKDLDKQIENDKNSLDQLNKVYFEKIFKELQYRQTLLNIAKAGGNEEEIKKAQAGVDAAQDAVVDARKKIGDAYGKLQDDELKKEKLGPPDNAKEWTKWAGSVVKIIDKVLENIRKLYDQRIENEINLVEKRKELLDQQYDDEANAIDKSTLKQKEKQALEIQIAAQKQVAGETAQREEIALKIKRFEFDKKIALAEAAIGIAAQIVKDGLKTPAAIADAIIGAAEIATILAQQPPSFAEGILDFWGGLARHSEEGPEWIKKPYEKPYLSTRETIEWLPKGTDIVPINHFPEFGKDVPNDQSWNQTRFLARQIKNNKQEIKNVFKPTIIINGDFENRKNQILGQ